MSMICLSCGNPCHEGETFDDGHGVICTGGECVVVEAVDEDGD